MEAKHKKITVIGMGRTGIAAANFLARRGARVTLIDQKKAPLETQVHLDAKVTALFEQSIPPADSELIVLSPGVDINSSFLDKARQRETEIISEIELAYRFNQTPIIAITGTNGKTTTTTLLGRILQEAGKKSVTGGNIGTPFISLVDGESRDFVVLEISSFQLEGISQFRPKIAVILNLSPDHLDRHQTMAQYAALKRKITTNQNQDDLLILNADDPQTRDLGRGARARQIFFSTQKEVREGAFLRDGIITVRLNDSEREICAVERLKPVMQWQMENILAATTAASLAGADAPAIAKSIRTFPGLEHRMEWIRNLQGIDFVNDSKGTNIGSTQKSLNSFQRPIILILGGRDKGADFSPLSPLIKAKVKHLILIGEAKAKIKQILNGSTPWEEADTLETAVKRAWAQAASGDVVLLSPACASFDMFRDYEDRGRQFRTLVNLLS
ncbi:MAG: UDP-N-acetylmuramoyl-L-alanine--D-glutamate ligase [Nitrospinales bacterium]